MRRLQGPKMDPNRGVLLIMIAWAVGLAVYLLILDWTGWARG